MTIASGDALPNATIHQNINGKISETSLNAWAQGRKVILVTVPGAFTPTCSEKHLPGYIALASELRAKGVDAIGCLAVNDAYVMGAWGQKLGADGKVDMLADAEGNAAKAMGIASVMTPVLGTTRAARMALIAEDGTCRHVFIEEAGALAVSTAESVMAHL